MEMSTHRAILLLGATGLLGHNVLLELLDRGYTVRALVRSATRLQLDNEHLQSDRLQIIEGSLLSDSDLQRAAEGCDAIVNCAGTTDMSLLQLEDYRPVNTTLCKRLLAAMEQHGINTLVHVSTANTIGYGRPGHEADEDSPMEPPFSQSLYAVSKQEGERELLQAAAQKPWNHIVIVNPGFMLGAYDAKPSSGKLLLAAKGRRLMVAPKGGKSFVPVHDCAVATVNALTMGRNGGRYLLTGKNMTLREFYRIESKVLGYRQQLIALPDWLVLAAGRLGDMLRSLGLRTQLSSNNVRQLMVTEHYSNSRACQELEMPVTNIEPAIQEFNEWHMRHLRQK